MPHSVIPGPHPDFYILTYSGDLQYEELFLADELHLNEGRPIYILMDSSQMNNTLPEHFLDGIVKSFVVHPNMGYLAAFIPSMTLRVAGHMVVKVTQRQKRITIFQSYDAAYRMIEKVICQRNISQSAL